MRPAGRAARRAQLCIQGPARADAPGAAAADRAAFDRFESVPGLGGVLPEVTARCLLSIAAGTADGVEDAAEVCKFDPRLAEGLVRVAGARARDSDLVDYAALASAPGFARLCQWMALPHLQACSLVALAKRDATSLD